MNLAGHPLSTTVEDYLASLDKNDFAMTNEEYSILFYIALQSKAKKILEFGRGTGISGTVMLLANPENYVISVDIKDLEESIKNVPVYLRPRLYSFCQTTERFQSENNDLNWDLILVDANHMHDPASADINWAVDHGSIVVAHDIIHEQTEHIDELCKNASARTGKRYYPIKIGRGLGVLY